MKKTVKYDIYEMLIEVTYVDKKIDDVQIFASESFTMTEDKLSELRDALNDILDGPTHPHFWPHPPGTRGERSKEVPNWTINNQPNSNPRSAEDTLGRL